MWGGSLSPNAPQLAAGLFTNDCKHGLDEGNIPPGYTTKIADLENEVIVSAYDSHF